jgi:hypothetical protein
MGEHEKKALEQGSFDVLVTEEEFLAKLPPYLAVALQESLEPVFHVFSDNKDLWTQNTHIAYEIFILWVQKFETARLYIELYEGNDKVHEDGLLFYGDFPM